MSNERDFSVCVCSVFSQCSKEFQKRSYLEAINTFKQFYEKELKSIDEEGLGHCLEIKLKLQQKWIEDLTEQTKCLAKIILQLEKESIDQRRVLEEQLKETSKTAYEDIKLAAKTEIKKLRHQNRHYEQIVQFSKNDIDVMSEQLSHLQEILNLSNQSCHEENGQLYTSLLELHKICEKVHKDLINTEKKYFFECQKNQIKDSKIEELQTIIDQMSADLNLHDDEINSIKIKLEQAVIEYHECQQTIATLNRTVVQCNINHQDMENENTLSTKSVTKLAEEHMSKQFEMLKLEYNNQFRFVKKIQNELERVKERSKEKNKNLKRENEDLKDKLASYELHNKHLLDELSQIRKQTIILAEKECSTQQELVQSRQVILELRQTLTDLNESLTQSENQQMLIIEEYGKIKIKENQQQKDIFLNCRDEITSHKKLVENLQETLLTTQKELSEAEKKNLVLKQEIQEKETTLSNIENKMIKQDKETCQCINEYSTKLKKSQAEEQRLQKLVDTLQQDLKTKNLPQQNVLTTHNQNANTTLLCQCCKCNLADNNQEEITELQIEIKKFIQTQLALNNENDKLLKEVVEMRNTITNLENKNKKLKQKLEKIHQENQNLKEKNNVLEKEKTEKIKNKTQCYGNTTQHLKTGNASILHSTPIPTFLKTNLPKIYENDKNKNVAFPVDGQQLWTSESHSTFFSSLQDGSFLSSLSCSIDEWHAPNYKDEDETTDDEFRSKLEAIAKKLQANKKTLMVTKCVCRKCDGFKND